jgi:hypothetical protein
VDCIFRYGAVTLFGRPSQAARLSARSPALQLPSQLDDPTTRTVQRRQACIRPVWADPRSLATTRGVSFDLLS